jgi:LPS-assembly protein
MGSSLITAMLKLGAWIISPLICLPLQAQEAQVLPVPGPAPAVDTITPVPAPEIPFGALGPEAPALPKELKIDNYGGGIIEWNNALGLLTYKGPGIKLTGDNGLEVYADRAVVDTKAETAVLEGNVSVYQGNVLQRGERVVYDAKTKHLDASGLRASLDPILLEAGKFHVENRGGKNVYIGENAGVTTHDVEDPNYWLRAKKTTIYPGEKVVFNDLRVYAGDTPVFWLPYLSQPLSAELGYHFYPGARSNWGPFLLNTYGIMLGGETNPETGENENAWLLSRWNFDIRTRRGLGTGVDLVDTRIENNEEISGFSAYYLNDLDPGTRRAGIPRGFVNEDRYQFKLKHRQELLFPDPSAEWRLDTNLTFLSDEHYLEDFDQDRYRSDPAPDNTIGIYRRDDASLLSLYARLRLNDFYRTDTRLPEVAFDQARRPLFDLPILHEGNTSLGVIGEKASDPTSNAILNPLLQLTSGDPAAQRLLSQLDEYDRRLAEEILALPFNDPRRAAIRTQLLDSSYVRFNTYQEVSMPFTLGNFLNLAPQAGLGYTSYGSVEGPVDSFDRTYLHAGVESSVKFSKDLGNYRNAQWGLDGMKHVLQPYTTWSVISTNDFDPTGPMVDRLTPTTRPRPLDPTRFTAVDELQDWNVVRLGTRNRLLTKRDQQSFEWLFLDTYVDAFIDDPEGSRNFSNLYNEARWQPVPWMSAHVETQLPLANNGSGFSEFNTRLRFLPTDHFEFTVGYRMLNGHPVLLDSNRIELQNYTRLNENWGFGMEHVYEMDDNTLELEQYTLHRDLGNWVAGVGITHRDNRLEEEYGVIFTLSLKDFPSATLPFRFDTE